MIKLISKMIALSVLTSFSMLKSQSVKEILKENGSFRKDTVLSVKSDSKETYLPVTIIKGKEKARFLRLLLEFMGMNIRQL
ncbi:hypothetical protein [Chryseobacterium schmidteae]|uniref:hypothetical protein n=1 Tax=Chryseobacterium schmidteae TaxID=2730404 RepID=UPI00158B8C12|nr:hypothetical protein [Chryseobacterium schmidteae]